MAKSNKVVPKKRRGRPATGRDPVTAIRLAAQLKDKLEAWAAQQPDNPGRSEAIRRLVELGLKTHTLEPKAVGRLRERVASGAELAAKAVDSLTVGAADADEKASRKRRRTKAKGK
jgi:hypothetical protein